MNKVFKPFLRKTVLILFDDILIYSTDLDAHQIHLEEVLKTMKYRMLFAKRSKCHFAVNKVEYLGQQISSDGVKADPKKIEAMIKWPKPATMKALRGFLGLTGYYWKFIRGYEGIAGPLTRLLKNDGFSLNKAAEQVFTQFKEAEVEPLVLRLPDFFTSFIVKCDASRYMARELS